MSDVIKEFLVSLGYKIDATGERRFTDGIKEVSKTVTELGAAAAATATAVAASVVKMASKLDDLYFASQRTKASAENIKALSFAADQMGSSAGAAEGSLEAFAKFLRTNPGGENLIRSWGVQTRDVNGNLSDTSEMLKDLGGVFRNMPYSQAYRRAQVLGIDEKTLIALIKGMDGFESRYKQILARYGLDTDKAAERSHQLMLGVRDLKANMEVLGLVIGTRLIGIFDELEYRWNSLDGTTKQNIETLGKWAAAILAGAAIIASGPLGWVAALGAAILLLWDDYKVWKEGGKSLIDWGRWKPEIDLAKAGIAVLGDGIHNMQSAYEAAWPHILKGWTDLTADVKDAYQWIMKVIHAVEDSKAFKWVMDHTQGARDDIAKSYDAAKDWIAGHLPASSPGSVGDLDAAKNALNEVWSQITGKPYKKGVPDTTSSNTQSGTPRGIRNNNPGNIKYGPFAQHMGATGQDPNGFAIFPSPIDGLKAIAANLSSYGRQGFNTPSEIAHRWSTTDQDAYTKRLADLFGGDANQQLNLSDPNVVNRLMDGIINQENGTNPYKSEMLAPSASQATAPPNATGASLTQTTSITVYGAKDPQDTAHAVAGEQTTVNQRLTRNLQFATAT